MNKIKQTEYNINVKINKKLEKIFYKVYNDIVTIGHVTWYIVEKNLTIRNENAIILGNQIKKSNILV